MFRSYRSLSLRLWLLLALLASPIAQPLTAMSAVVPTSDAENTEPAESVHRMPCHHAAAEVQSLAAADIPSCPHCDGDAAMMNCQCGHAATPAAVPISAFALAGLVLHTTRLPALAPSFAPSTSRERLFRPPIASL